MKIWKSNWYQIRKLAKIFLLGAEMVELADTQVLGACA